MKTLKLIGAAFIAAFMCECFVACSDEDTVSQIEIKEGTDVSIKIGEKQTLHALHYPEDLMAPEFIWSSANPDIVSVDEATGTISAKTLGETMITVRALETLSATCKVKVLPIEAESVSINYKEYTLEVEETFELKATILPLNTTDKAVEWSSSDDKIVKLHKKSQNEVVVEALSEGQCKIVAAVKSGKIVAECNVTVNKISVKGIEVEEDINVMIGDEYQITYTIKPENAANKNVIWSCDDSSIASVSETGIIKGLNYGSTKVTVKTEDGNYSAICNVTVTDIVGMLQGNLNGGVKINGYLMPGDYRCSIKNKSSKDIYLKSLQLIDTSTMIGGNIMEIPGTPMLKSGEDTLYTLTIKKSIYEPILRWTIIYEDVEYTYDYKDN